MLIVTLIYMPIVPAGIILCSITHALQYALLKYKLFNHHKIPRQLNSYIIHRFAGLLSWCTFLSVIALYAFVIFEQHEAEKLAAS